MKITCNENTLADIYVYNFCVILIFGIICGFFFYDYPFSAVKKLFWFIPLLLISLYTFLAIEEYKQLVIRELNKK